MARLDAAVSLLLLVGSHRQRSLLKAFSSGVKALSLILLAFFSVTSLGQIGGTTAGIVPFGSYMPVEAGTVNLANLNVLFEIPLRNKLGFFTSSLAANDLLWISSGGTSPAWVSTRLNQWNLHSTLGGQFFATAMGGIQGCGNNANTTYGYFEYVESNGTVHNNFSNNWINSQGCGYPLTSSGSDDLGWSLFITGDEWGGYYATVYDPAGNEYGTNPNNHSQTGAFDPNGNTLATAKLSLNTVTITDATGNTVLTENYGASYITSYSYNDQSGNAQAYTLTYTSYAVQTNFGCSGIKESGPSAPIYFLTNVQRPDKTNYAITYEQTPGYPANTTGRIGSITLPTGTKITYTYNGTNNGISCQDAGNSGFQRQTPDGTWTYSRSYSSTTKQWTTVVTAPSGQTASYTFTSGSSYYVVQEVVKEATGTTTGTFTTCYNGNATNCSAVSSVTGLFLPTETDVYSQFAGSSQQSIHKSVYDSITRLTEDKVTDFTGTVLSDKFLYYGTYTGSGGSNSCAAITANVPNRVCYVQEKDASNVVHQVNFTYDSQGNLLSQTTLTNLSTGAGLKKSFTRNSNGTINTATDVNATVTTYSNYQCNLLPGTVTAGGLSTSTTWDCNGAVPTQTTDANSQPTTYTNADPFWRITSVTDPSGATTSLSYTANSVESKMLFNSAKSVTDSLTTLDGFGRLVDSQQRVSPSGSYNTVSTNYDTNGRLLGKSQPCSKTTAGATCTANFSTQTYDALNRPLVLTESTGATVTHTYTGNDDLQVLGPTPQTFSKQTEADALGRLTSVCEVSSTLPGVNTCSQVASTTGWWTKYAYSSATSTHTTTVTQNAQGSPTQSRTYIYDPADRLTQEVNPENGTVAYTYDTMPTGCPGSGAAYSGDLVAITKNGTLSNCFQYDALRRKTFAGMTGPICRHFIYDSATVNHVAMTNPAGRLAEAKTDNCSSTTYTDEGFSYDTRGYQTDFYESTPNSSGYYHVGKTFWSNSALETLSGLSLPTLTYNPDGMGRVSSVSSSVWTNPLSSVGYNVFSEATSATFGSGDKTTFNFDTAGRMTYANEKIGGTVVSNNYTYSPNGTLHYLQINNAFNTADNKTCAYTYNDVGSVASAECGTGKWGQTFTYDASGNVTKAVPLGYTGITWMPGYNASNNQYQLGGTSYDTNGNLLADTFHSYSWDANHGDMLSVDSTSMTYDALGRQVEMTTGSTHTQFVYALGKRLAVMNGQTETSAFVPLVGGMDVQYNASGIVAYRVADWRGSKIIGSSPSQTYIQGADYAPFGELMWSTGSSQNVFSEIGADTVSGEYDAFARKQNPTQGRWLSPDPAGLGAGDPGNPQTWNRYAYVTNNPLAFIDPTGNGGCAPGATCPPNPCGPGYALGCNTSGNFPSLAGGLFNWDPLNILFAGGSGVQYVDGGCLGCIDVPAGVFQIQTPQPPPPPQPPTPPAKSPARQKCEQQAQQKYSYAQQAIPNTVAIAGNIALDVGMGVAAIGGCVAGGTAGTALGPGGTLAGCFGGAALSVPAAAPEILGTTALVMGATYLWESYSAKQDFNAHMNACSKIP